MQENFAENGAEEGKLQGIYKEIKEIWTLFYQSGRDRIRTSQQRRIIKPQRPWNVEWRCSTSDTKRRFIEM